jgi:ParB family chromosome partitioning protein
MYLVKTETPARPELEVCVQLLPIGQVQPDPGQPRKRFDQSALRDLAASIRADGLLQPITVREVGRDAYMIVAGERRYRASQLNNAPTIRAIVMEPADSADVRVKQIIENDQRVDVTPLEQGRSYQALMDESGWTVEQLAQRIGKAAFRITERTILLNLDPEHQALLESGNLKPTEAYELARLSRRGQAVLFAAIRTGKCRNNGDLRAMSNALIAAEAQPSFMQDERPAPSKEETQQMTAFEANVEKVAALLRSGINDNQVTAVRKINPHRAGHLADLMAAMQKDLRRIEVALRETAVQASFLDAAE